MVVMKFYELAKTRFSARKFKDKKVNREKLIKLVEAARVAPSAVNYQPWYFIVVDKKDLLEKLWTTYKREWIKSAPAIIVACGDKEKSWKRNDGKDHMDIDVSIAIDHMTLEATDIGLGTCWVCAFNSELCKEILSLPENIEPIALLPVGYPEKEGDFQRHDKTRCSIESIMGWNGYYKNN